MVFFRDVTEGSRMTEGSVCQSGCDYSTLNVLSGMSANE